jgi:hypothetical protein
VLSFSCSLLFSFIFISWISFYGFHPPKSVNVPNSLDHFQSPFIGIRTALLSHFPGWLSPSAESPIVGADVKPLLSIVALPLSQLAREGTTSLTLIPSCHAKTVIVSICCQSIGNSIHLLVY